MKRGGNLARVLSILVVSTGSLVGAVGISAFAQSGAHASDVSGSITLDGTPVGVTISSAGVNGSYTFSGTTGQRVAVALSGSTFGPDCPAVKLSLRRPDATTLGSPSGTCTATGFLDTQTLDQTGTWTVFVDPQLTDVGSATLRAWSVPADQTAGLIRNGPSIAVNLATPGQNGRFTFTGTVGQQVSALLSSSTFSPGCPSVVVALLRPDGSQASSVSTCNASAFLDTTTIDQAGTWTALVDPRGAATGTATLQAYDLADQVKPININGAPIGVSLSTAGQNGSYTFSGTTGQKISANVTNSTFAGCPAYLYSLVRPDGSTLATPLNGCGASTFFEGQTLDQTGTWTFRIDPQGTVTGTANLQAYDATDQTRAIALNGAAVALNLTKPGENGRLTFTGSLGQSVAAQLSSATFAGTCPTFAFSLIRPDGTTLGSPVTSCTASAALASQSLDQAGTWTLLVDPQGTATGSASVQAFVTSDDVRPINPNGAPLNYNLIAGQKGVYTFAGTTGQQVSAEISSSTFPGCPGYVLTLKRPDATVLGSGLSGCGASGFLDSQTLDQTGTWAFVVTPQGNAGTGTIQAHEFSDLTAPADLTGKALKLVFTQPGQNALLSFTGAVGKPVSAYLTGSSVGAGCPAVMLSLVRPNGTTLGTPVSTCTDSAFLDTVKLDQAGTWTVFIDPQGTNTGTLFAQVYNIVDDVRKISPSAGVLRSFTAQEPGANGRFTFTGSVGQIRRVTVTFSTFTGCPAIVASFVRPDGSILSTTSTCTASLVLGPTTLDATGTWTLFVDPQGPTTGTLVMKLSS